MEMSRLTRDETADSASRDQILRREHGQGNIHFPCSADHDQDWQPYPVDPYYSCYMCDHTYIHTSIRIYRVLLHQALVRSLRESKVQFVVEDTWPFRQKASEQNSRLNPLCMDITTEAGALFDNHLRLKNKALLLDITIIINSCAGSNLGNAARHVEKHLADEVERKKYKYRGSFPATYSLVPLAMSTCGEVGLDVHAFIKGLAIRRVQHRSETHSNESQHLAEGTEVARLRRRLSFVTQQALSFRTRHHLCRQGVALARTRQPRSQGPASVQVHRTGGVTEPEGQEGANGVGGVGGGDVSWGRGRSGNGNGGGGERRSAERERERELGRGGNGDGNGDGDGDGGGDP